MDVCWLVRDIPGLSMPVLDITGCMLACQGYPRTVHSSTGHQWMYAGLSGIFRDCPYQYWTSLDVCWLVWDIPGLSIAVLDITGCMLACLGYPGTVHSSTGHHWMYAGLSGISRDCP